MLLRFLNFATHAAVQDKGKPCPRCGNTNTDKQGGIWYCYDCEKEFG